MENDFHQNCFACGSKNGAGLGLKFHKEEDGSVFGDFLADTKFESYSGIVHGGIMATLLDSAITHCLFCKGHSCSYWKIVDQVFTPHSDRKRCEVRSENGQHIS